MKTETETNYAYHLRKLQEEGHAVLVIHKTMLDGADPEKVIEEIEGDCKDEIRDIIKHLRPYNTELGFQILKTIKGEEGVVVEVSTTQGWVSIEDGAEIQDDIFLQGVDGYYFIEEAQELYEWCGNISLDDAYLYCALPYVEACWV